MAAAVAVAAVAAVAAVVAVAVDVAGVEHMLDRSCRELYLSKWPLRVRRASHLVPHTVHSFLGRRFAQLLDGRRLLSVQRHMVNELVAAEYMELAITMTKATLRQLTMTAELPPAASALVKQLLGLTRI